ncbi:hypothetical protein CY34DRAFT_809473 [Suillus luteus UH-Slu-Lm8-n1]|uniref:Uncharacterized protein n=1 Tax=Suillus luteus UH-Slu-Lm8-n1 TaxID=930992 RepID=A0A0D0A998_9AGAM|nr:hypothetical protein CY34DRAFT_809473 [Suillus luteus UH-Slu-Lm8-n1]
MRFAFVVAVFAAVVSATDAVSEGCPIVCLVDSHCKSCSDDQYCVLFFCYPHR